jgi:hypothetical protein
VENALVSGNFPVSVNTEETVTQLIVRARSWKRELNLQIPGTRPDRHSALEGEGLLVKSHLFNQGPEMTGLHLAARVDAEVPRSGSQPEMAALIRPVRTIRSGAARRKNSEQDAEEQKARESSGS